MDRFRKLFSRKKKGVKPEYTPSKYMLSGYMPSEHIPSEYRSSKYTKANDHIFSPRPRSRPKYDVYRNIPDDFMFSRKKRHGRKKHNRKKQRSFGKCPCSSKKL